MSETMAAPGGGDSAASAPAPAPSPAPSSDFQASAGSGNAPEAGGDATTGDLTASASPAAAASAKFRFLNREWNDLSHAEQSIKAQIGRIPETQRQNAELTRKLAEASATIEALQRVAAGQRGGEAGQGAPQGRQDGGAAPQSLAEQLATDGTLKEIAEIANDPNYGIGHAMFVMAEAMEKAVNKRFESFRGDVVDPFIQKQTQAQHVARGFSATRELVTEGFPELDNDNHSPEAEEAQAHVLDFIRQIPPETFVQDPKRFLRLAVLDYRHANGTPVFAQPPGSSGSPSDLASRAAERAAGGASPLDGTGVPRPGNGKEGPVDRMRRENKIQTEMVTTAGGRKVFRLD
jgi:hypothetical protein